MIKLERPIVFFDLETTGLDVQNDRIVEIAMIKINPDGTRVVKDTLVNPTISIPAGASEVHGIYDDDVKDKPTFKQLSKSIHEFILGCDLGGYNCNIYDIPLIYNEFLRVGIEYDYSSVNFVDVGNIFKINEPRSLSAAMKFYCKKEMEDAHSAIADTEATVSVFIAQIKKYKDMPKSIDELSLFSNYDKKILDISGKFTTDSDGEIILNFGKHKGELAKNCLSFLEWMVYKANFSPDTTKIALQILNDND